MSGCLSKLIEISYVNYIYISSRESIVFLISPYQGLNNNTNCNVEVSSHCHGILGGGGGGGVTARDGGCKNLLSHIGK